MISLWRSRSRSKPTRVTSWGAIRFARIRCLEVNDLPSVPGFMRFVTAVRALHATGRRAEQATGRGSRESTQEQFRGGIGEPQSTGSQLKPVLRTLAPAALSQLFDFPGPTSTKVVPGGLLELGERPAGVHSQTERRGLARSGQRGQFFARVDGRG